MAFTESSALVRTYDWCGSFIEFVGRPFEVIVPERGPEGINLCTLTRRYAFAGLAAFLIAACGLGLSWLMYMIFDISSITINDYEYYLEINEGNVFATLMQIPAVIIFGGVLGGLVLVAMCGCLLYVAFAMKEHRNGLVRSASFVLRMVAMAIGYTFFGLILALYYSLIWPVRKLWQMLRGKTPEKSPSLFKVVGQWIYGRMHGICFQIDVVPG